MEKLKNAIPYFQRGPKTDEKIIWSKQGAQELREKVRAKATRMPHSEDPPRILFVGETGSGKSSFISGVMSALSGEVTYAAKIGEKEGQEENTSKRYMEYRVFMGEDPEPLNFILCDARGIGKKNQMGVADREIERLMDGKLRDGDLIESERDSDGIPIDNRDPKPPSCVVFVQKAQRLGEVDKDVQEKLSNAAVMATGRGMNCSVVLTHIDTVKPSLKLHKALTNRTLQENVERAAREIGVKTNRVFLVKNYTKETRTHVRQDILILRALHAILVDVSTRHRTSFAAAKSTTRKLSRNHLGSESSYSSLQIPSSLDSHYSSAMSVDSGPSTSVSMSVDSGPSTSVSRQFMNSSDQKRVSSGWQPRPYDRTENAVYQSTSYTSRYELMGFHGVMNSELSEETIPKSSMAQALGKEFHPNPQSPYIQREGYREIRIRKVPPARIYSGNDSDREYNPEELDSDDEGFQSEVLSLQRMEPCFSHVLTQTIIALAERFFPEEYKEEAMLRGAKPLYQPTILQLNHTSRTCTDTDREVSLQLTKTFADDGQLHTVVIKALRDLAGTETGSAWMSCTLPADLALPMDTLPPDSTVLQVFFLSPQQPPFLLTLFDMKQLRRQSTSFDEPGGDVLHEQYVYTRLEEEESVPENTSPGATLWGAGRDSLSEADEQEETDKVRLYTLQLGKLLTAALLDYCSCDFLLLPCCLSVAEFTLERLQRGLQEQLKVARQFYGGPVQLSPATYQEMKAAAVAVTGVTCVPRLLLSTSGVVDDKGLAIGERQRQYQKQPQHKQQLVLMDPDWRAAVSLLVETLTGQKRTELTYPQGAGFKTRVALLEAARRLSFVDHVLLVTDSGQLRDAVRDLRTQVYEDTGLWLKLAVESPGGLDDPGPLIKGDDSSRPTYVILLDCPRQYNWQDEDCWVLRVSVDPVQTVV
ncbi:uncharacterized protein LOC143286954 [Babylonia areolata]|uniref:uncharacterized protein LOC143286954 n=1 Tax=Babylonia areolata TaxID=304850 RepID=UPI003FD18914